MAAPKNFDEKRQIRAVIRVRPHKPEEELYIDCSRRLGNKLELATLDYSGAFASVLGPDSNQAEVFRSCGLPLVDATLSGKKTCLFAYGQVPVQGVWYGGWSLWEASDRCVSGSG